MWDFEAVLTAAEHLTAGREIVRCGADRYGGDVAALDLATDGALLHAHRAGHTGAAAQSLGQPALRLRRGDGLEGAGVFDVSGALCAMALPNVRLAQWEFRPKR